MELELDWTTREIAQLSNVQSVSEREWDEPLSRICVYVDDIAF